MGKDTAIQVLDGLMLGDASIGLSRGRSPHFCITLSAGADRDLRDAMLSYLRGIKDSLGLLGIEPCSGHPKAYVSFSKGRHYYAPTLRSHVSDFTVEQRCRWYANGVKIVPQDVIVTPLSLAYWYMCDGSSSYGAGSCVNTRLSTKAFSTSDIKLLKGLLGNLGIRIGYELHGKCTSAGDGIVITVKQDSIDRFMSVIKPHMQEPYLYKIKYREKACMRNTRVGLN